MNSHRIASLTLAALLHVAPVLSRAVAILPSQVSSPAAILFKWVVGALVVGGTMHTVSAATAALVSASNVSGQTGSRLSYQIRINDGKNRLPGSWLIGGKTFNNSGSTTNSLPPGLSLALSTAIISGTPKTKGTYAVPITAYEHSNRGGGRLSFTLTFNIAGSAAPPAITQQPVGGTVQVGNGFTFSVVATGDTPLSYQWTHAGAAITGATLASYTLAQASLADSGNYSVTISNPGGSIDSESVHLEVTAPPEPPAIREQPASSSYHQGDALSIPVTATGTPPLSYQWSHDGSPIASGGSQSALSIPSVGTGDSGTYMVTVTGPGGTVSSNPIQISIVPLHLGTPIPNGTTVQLELTTIPGRHYLLEANPSLDGATWNPNLEITATGGTTTVNPSVTSSAIQFWRYRTVEP